MDAKGYAHAERARDKAGRALDRLRGAKSHDELVDAWEDFLNATEKVYQKLKAASRGDPKSWGWYGRIDQESGDDELLDYVRHARDTDYHRFEEVAAFSRGGIAIGGPGTGFTSIKRLRVDPKEGIVESDWFSIGERPGVEIHPPHLRPLDVTTRGRTYAVPTKHLDHPLRTSSVVEIAELTQRYLDTLLVAASHFLR